VRAWVCVLCGMSIGKDRPNYAEIELL